MNCWKSRAIVLFATLLLPWNALAQSETAPSVTLESPYNTIYVHLYYLQSDTYYPNLAARTLNIRDSTAATRLAIQLKQILDGKGLFVHLNLLPQEPDYVDSLTQKPFYTPFPVELPEVYLEKVNDRWYYAQETIAAIPALHKEVFPFGSDFLLNLLPKNAQQRFLGLALWQYLGLIILMILLWLAHLLLSRLFRPVVTKLSQLSFKGVDLERNYLYQVASLVSILVLIRLFRMFLPALHLPIQAAEFIVIAVRILSTLVLVLLALRILNLVMRYAKRFTSTTQSKLDEQLVPILRRSAQILIVIAGIIQILRLLDVNVTALIAGISIGGLALALAAQDTVKNLIGSAMIFVDRPFQIGDYIEGTDFAGTIKEVGFRSTRIEQVDTSIISVPNGTIANMAIKNLGIRIYRILNTNLTITYSTPPDLIEKFMEGLLALIQAHPQTRKEAYYVHLTAMNDSSLNIMFRVYLEVAAYDQELKVKQDIMLGILRLAEVLGVDFAFPSTSVYVEQLPGPGNGTSAVAAQTAGKDVDQEMKHFIEAFKSRVQQPETQL